MSFCDLTHNAQKGGEARVNRQRDLSALNLSLAPKIAGGNEADDKTGSSASRAEQNGGESPDSEHG